MASLLDIQTPEGQALFAAAQGLLAPSRGIRGVGAGLLAANQAFAMQPALQRQAEMEKMRMSLLQSQVDENRMQIEEKQRARGIEDQLAQAARDSYTTPDQARLLSTGPMPDGSNMQATPGFNQSMFLDKATAISPMRGLELRAKLAKDDKPIVVGNSLLTPSGKVLYQAPDKESLPAAVKEYQYAQSQGYGGSFLDFQLSNKKAGANNVNLKVETKTGESLAKEIGPMMSDSLVAANGAAQQADAANRIIQAVNTNKIFAGPGATARLKLAQWADVLNLGGRDDAEKIANTRAAIRGLSEMTLQGRKQMRGQGAITESESALAEKATSGNIDELTPSEIRQLANASARAAKFMYDQHTQRTNVIKNNPSMAQMAPFYEPMPWPSATTTPAAPAAPGQATLRWNPQTGTLEPVR